MILWLFSVLFLVFGAWCASGRLARSGDGRMWAALAVAQIEILFLAFTLSIFHQLNASAWLTAQGVITLAFAGWGRRDFPAWGRLSKLFQESVAISQRTISWKLLWPSLLLLGLIATAAFFPSAAFWHVAHHPICGFDELMYHYPRVLHAIQEHTLFLPPSPNERQEVFPWGSELWMLWPLLFGCSQTVARLVFWAAYPLTVWAAAAVARRLGASGSRAWLAAALWSCTPLVFAHGMIQKPELWLALWYLGLFRTLAGAGAISPPRQSRCWQAAGVFLGLAYATKFSALSLVPPVALILLLLLLVSRKKRSAAWHAAACIGCLTATLILTGNATLLARNVHVYGGIHGPEAFVNVHRVPLSAERAYTHLLRFHLELLDFPCLSRGCALLEIPFHHMAGIFGAERVLEREGGSWPGTYAFYLPAYATRLGVGGLLWHLLMLFAIIGALKGFRIRSTKSTGTASTFHGGACAIVFTGAISALSIILTLLWQCGAMMRFVIAPFASIPPLAALMARGSRIWMLVAALTLLQAAGLCWNGLIKGHSMDEASPLAVASFEGINDVLPPGARVLAVESQNCREGALFDSAPGKPRRVIVPWNDGTDWGELERLVLDRDLKFVLLESVLPLSRVGRPSYDPKPLIEYLKASGRWSLVPYPNPAGHLLFERK